MTTPNIDEPKTIGEKTPKTCIDCKETRLLEDFPKDKRRQDGRGSYCRACARIRVRNFYERDPEKKAARLAYGREYRKKHRERLMKKQYELKKKNPMVNKARKAIGNAIAAGKLQKEPCDQCGESEVQFHHTNGYAKENWFIGRWMCPPHHRELHKLARREKERQLHPYSAKLSVPVKAELKPERQRLKERL